MFLILLLALAVGQIAAQTREEFSQKIKEKCFKEKPDLWNPQTAVSMENFIYMVEKIERGENQIKAEDLARELLHRFSISGWKLTVNGDRDDRVRYFDAIVKKFLEGYKPFSQQVSLTDEEECQLFFMLSPTKQVVKNTDNSDDEITFYEHGVVSLNADKERAIDLSKVLYGIFAGFQNGKTKKVKELVHFTGETYEYDDNELDMLYSFTVSEVVNAALSNEFENVHKGEWRSTVCSKEYIHDGEFTRPTTAEVAGAVDGFMLGLKIRSMGNKNDIKLSQILRMYYSKAGFKENTVDPSVESYCESRFKSIDSLELNRQTYNYMLVYQRHRVSTALEKEVIDRIVNNFHPATILLQTEAEREACAEDIGKKDTCETPSNLFAFLDKRNTNSTLQKSILGELINGLNIGLDEDTVTIYSNADMDYLQLIVNASDSKAHSACSLEDFNLYASQSSSDDTRVLNEIRDTLSVYEENQKSLLAVPSKVVVIFNFGDLKAEMKRDLDAAARELRRRHPYLTMIPIGSNSEYLKSYFANKQPINYLGPYDSDLIPELKKKICEAPAVLQYPNCRTKSSFQETEHKGYINVYHVQHWAMYPKYFLKSFGYKFQFKSQFGNIRVCFSRKEPITDSGSSAECKETTIERTTVEFSKSNPCKGKTVHNCDPFYFSIFGRDTTNEEVCKREIDGTNIGCKRLDQIEYTISHEGVSCNSAKQLIGSPLFQTLLTLLITFYILAWKK